MATDWGKILNNRFSQIVLVIILFLLLTITCVGLFSNKHIKLGPIEFNGQKENDYPKEGNILVKTDTFYKPSVPNDTQPVVVIQSKKTNADKKNWETTKQASNTQSIDSGGKGIQNNAPNYGNQAGGDINNFGIIPRKISEAELLPFINQLQNKNIEIVFVSYGMADAEMSSVKNQITYVFKNHGFTNFSPGFHLVLGEDPPQKIEVKLFSKQNVLEFHVPPAKL